MMELLFWILLAHNNPRHIYYDRQNIFVIVCTHIHACILAYAEALVTDTLSYRCRTFVYWDTQHPPESSQPFSLWGA